MEICKLENVEALNYVKIKRETGDLFNFKKLLSTMITSMQL